jgi:hypothetical protein
MRFQDLSKAVHYIIQLLAFYLLLCYYLLILKMLTETLLRISFTVIGQCSQVAASHWLGRKCARIKLSKAAFSMILQNLRWFLDNIFSVKIVALKQVTGGIFTKYLSRDTIPLKNWHARTVLPDVLYRSACTV